jgi:hypothetical protein
VGLGKQSSHDVASFSPVQFNVHLSSVAAGVRPQVVFDRQEIFEGFAFWCVEEDDDFATIIRLWEWMGFRLSF